MWATLTGTAASELQARHACVESSFAKLIENLTAHQRDVAVQTSTFMEMVVC
jgi:hypothetical protein